MNGERVALAVLQLSGSSCVQGMNEVVGVKWGHARTVKACESLRGSGVLLDVFGALQSAACETVGASEAVKNANVVLQGKAAVWPYSL